MEMVKAVGLKRYYDTEENEVRALDDVSLSVEEGEFLAIVGTSGSGKTTLLNLLGGLDIPTEGGVWIEGQSLRDMNNEERTVFRRKYIGFVFQQYNLVPILNIYENIVLPLRLDGAKIDDELLEEIVKFLGIKEKLGNLPKELSGGQQQRVAIARALLAKPALLLADEPTGNLDSKSGKIVIQALNDINKKYQKTIVMVTHDPQMASNCDRIILLKDGLILDELERGDDQKAFYQKILGRMEDL